LIVTFSDGITELFGVIASIALDPNGRDRIADLTKIRMLRTLLMFSCVNAGPATDAVRLAASLFSPGQSSFPTSPAGQMGSLTQFARSSPFETSARFNHRCSPDSSLTQASVRRYPRVSRDSHSDESQKHYDHFRVHLCGIYVRQVMLKLTWTKKIQSGHSFFANE
jgi:hypothetical protein